MVFLTGMEEGGIPSLREDVGRRTVPFPILGDGGGRWTACVAIGSLRIASCDGGERLVIVVRSGACSDSPRQVCMAIWKLRLGIVGFEGVCICCDLLAG